MTTFFQDLTQTKCLPKERKVYEERTLCHPGLDPGSGQFTFDLFLDAGSESGMTDAGYGMRDERLTGKMGDTEIRYR